MSLLRWVWRAYVRNALVPLLVVELLLVAVYLASHAWSLRERRRAVRKSRARNCPDRRRRFGGHRAATGQVASLGKSCACRRRPRWEGCCARTTASAEAAAERAYDLAGRRRRGGVLVIGHAAGTR
jgi:hypothetical protein